MVKSLGPQLTSLAVLRMLEAKFGRLKSGSNFKMNLTPNMLEPSLVGGFNPLKNISQIGNLPQIGVNIKNIWNHHLALMLHANIGQVTFFFPGRCSLTVHRSTARPTNESCTTWDPQCREWFSWQEVDIATQIGKHLCKKCMCREWGPIFGSYISTLTQLTLEVDTISRFLQNFNCGVPWFLGCSFRLPQKAGDGFLQYFDGNMM